MQVFGFIDQTVLSNSSQSAFCLWIHFYFYLEYDLGIVMHLFDFFS